MQLNLNRTRYWKAVVYDGISDGTKFKLVTALPFLKQAIDSLRTLALGFVDIVSGKE